MIKSKLRVILLSVVIASLWATSAFCAATTKPNLKGTYDATGTNPDGKGTYKAVLTITPVGDAYDVDWNLGSETFQGVGLLIGDKLSVGYVTFEGQWFGIVVYTVTVKSGKVILDGIWTGYGGDGKIGKETAKQR